MQPSRRDFVRAAAAVSSALPLAAQPAAPAALIEPFDYRGVRLRKSRWQAQFQSARDYYLAVSDDDILHGWRKAAGLPAPGKPLGGWCARNSDTVFGQWLSGMSRIYRAPGDQPLRDKADFLLAEWARTLPPDGNCGMDLYAYDKLLCGLVDLKIYADYAPAVPLLEKTLASVMRSFSKERSPATADRINARPAEWYTFAENLYRAWEVTGDPRVKDFASTYLDHAYWNKFAATSAPPDAHWVHAYSHVNTFSSAAKAYAVTGDPAYLSIIRNAYDYLQRTQCYATGGYGPMERLVPPGGTLGRSLEARPNSFEAVCGSWAGFKLSRYLMQFTGESRYGDWAERLFYNGVGAALPIVAGGKHFYYADYRTGGAMKFYKVSRYSCCSGTYLQNVADYHNLIYYRDPGALYVNLYLPSEVAWQRPEGEVRVVQETAYPEAETSTLTLDMPRAARFALKFRIPSWTRDASLKVNGAAVDAPCRPGAWA
ncbi:MAG: glycoside hydrolase family 127 protein, partial [Acidobacteriota bacterium]|nr:glycoside hydrolase family 127 protein [Acidobacteriota bacterium]